MADALMPCDLADVEEVPDQALVPTTTCTKWRCERAVLVLRGPFWCCPACGASYGEHAHG